MKKLFSVLGLFISLNCVAQCEGANANLQMEVRHWFWALNKYGSRPDSTSQARIRALRTQMIAANPVDSTSLVTINNVPAPIIIYIYDQVLKNDFGDYMLMGNNHTERSIPFTNIRAISQPCIISQVAEIDYRKSLEHWEGNKNGKAIIKDN